MIMQRYYINKKNIFNSQIIINDSDYKHIVKVMRMKKKDKIICFDGEYTYLTEIIDITINEVILEILDKKIENNEIGIDVTIAHGLVRKEKQEEVVEKISTLGASKYVSVIMDYSNVKVSYDKIERKYERLRKIAKEASEQSHRQKVLDVLEIMSFDEFLNYRDFDLFLYASTNTSDDLGLKKIIQNFNQKKILILIGPEGGISIREESLLKKMGFLPVSFGKRILRTETAPTFFMSALIYEKEL